MKSRSITIKEKKLTKIINKKKRTYLKNVTESIEEDQKHNTRKMYQTVNQLEKGYQHKFSIIRTKKGELTMNTRRKQVYGRNILTK